MHTDDVKVPYSLQAGFGLEVKYCSIFKKCAMAKNSVITNACRGIQQLPMTLRKTVIFRKSIPVTKKRSFNDKNCGQ